MGKKLSQIVETGASVQACDAEEVCAAIRINRREAVRQVGSWVVYLGALGVAASCGPSAINSEGPWPTSSSGTPAPTPTATPSPTSTPSATPTPSTSPTPVAACECGTTPTGSSWTNLSLATSAVPVNGIAYNSSKELYVCHDSTGFYCMTSVCPHEDENMGSASSVFSSTNLSAGFTCPHHNATFDANGDPTNSVTSKDLAHYALTTDSSDNLYADTSTTVASTCRC